jgi:hypothetical protein
MNGIKLFCLAVFVMIGFITCKSSGNKSTDTDSTKNQPLPPPSENSNATNPSLADTAYPSKDTMITHGDSVRAKK